MTLSTASGSAAGFRSNGIVTGWVQATINGLCGSFALPQFNVWAGTPSTPIPIDIQFDVPPHRITASVNDIQTATSYNWYLNGTLNSVHTTIARFSRTSKCGFEYDIQAEAVNSCGVSGKGFNWVYEPPCGNYLTLSPNPVSSNLIISINDTSTVKNSGLS